jgi:histidyl-tRNA synthetase
MRQATTLKARFAAILGESELSEGTVTLKDLSTGDENKLARNQAVANLVSAEEGS